MGKSTLVQHLFPSYRSVTFDPTIDTGGARQDPDLFLDNNPGPIVLDEIQYAPELAGAIKRRIDKDRQPGRYIITGSQQWSVMKTMAESLAGRAVFVDLYGFSIREIAGSDLGENWLSRWLGNPDEFGACGAHARVQTARPLTEQLWRGSMPEADRLELRHIPDFYGGYLRTYIDRDARLMADVSDWQEFGRFVRLCAALTAQEANHSQLGRDVSVTPQTARRWLAVLSSTYQWHSIPAFSGNATKRVSRKPKGYLLDTGLACFLQMISSPEALSGHPMVGALFETAVVAEVLKLAGSLSLPPSFYHWRSHGGAEVDLILERDGVLFPVEIKYTSQPSRQDTRGITALRATYPRMRIAPGLVIAPTAEFRRLCENNYAMPWDIK